MSDTLTTITKFINSPPGVLAAGGVLAGIVWKFFERVEAVLNDDTKLEIAVWLLDRKPLSPALHQWPDTFAKVFDRIFGERYICWRFFSRSMLFSIGALALSTFLFRHLFEAVTSRWGAIFLIAAILGNVLPGYLSFISTRYWIRKDAGISTTSHSGFNLRSYFLPLMCLPGIGFDFHACGALWNSGHR